MKVPHLEAREGPSVSKSASPLDDKRPLTPNCPSCLGSTEVQPLGACGALDTAGACRAVLSPLTSVRPTGSLLCSQSLQRGGGSHRVVNYPPPGSTKTPQDAGRIPSDNAKVLWYLTTILRRLVQPRGLVTLAVLLGTFCGL